MKISDIYRSSYLKATDITRPVNVTISRFTVEDVGGEDKGVLHFAGKDRGLVLNKTNAGLLAHVLGDETDGWLGKQVELYPDRVSMQGRIVDAIRVRIPRQAEAPAPAAAPATPSGEFQAPAATAGAEYNDDIPF